MFRETENQKAGQYAAASMQGRALVADVPVPSQSIHDVTMETIGGLHELRNALSSLADRVSGSIPETTGGIRGNIEKSQPCLMDQAQSVRDLVSQCHSEMARIQRVL